MLSSFKQVKFRTPHNDIKFSYYTSDLIRWAAWYATLKGFYTWIHAQQNPKSWCIFCIFEAREEIRKCLLALSSLTLHSLLLQQWEIICIPPPINTCPYTCAYVHTRTRERMKSFPNTLRSKLSKVINSTREPSRMRKVISPQFYSLYHPARLQMLHYQSFGKCFIHKGSCWHCAVLLLFCICCLN